MLLCCESDSRTTCEAMPSARGSAAFSRPTRADQVHDAMPQDTIHASAPNVYTYAYPAGWSLVLLCEIQTHFEVMGTTSKCDSRDAELKSTAEHSLLSACACIRYVCAGRSQCFFIHATTVTNERCTRTNHKAQSTIILDIGRTRVRVRGVSPLDAPRTADHQAAAHSQKSVQR